MSKPLGNKPGEPPFQLKVDPDTKLVFKYKLNEPCTIELKITNTTKDRQTFKVKCTDNDIFRVRPPLSFVKADETAVVK
ncbi:MSP domain protein, partial [Ostertagia ostertagi]